MHDLSHCAGGEDCRFKVWDAHGRLLHCSQPLEHPVTAIAWSSSGDVFAVGSFNCLLLVEASGKCATKARNSCGSVLR